MDTMMALAQLQEENRLLRETLEKSETLIRHLELRVKDLAAQIYGPSSEKRRREEDKRQSTLDGIEEDAGLEQERFFADAPAKEKKPVTKSRSTGKKKGPKPLPAHLPRVIKHIDDPDLKDLICPETGKLMKPAFQQKIEVLSRKPAEYFVTRYIRNVFVSPAKTAPVTTDWPAYVLPKARVDVSIIAETLVKRYVDHLPFHRIEKQFIRLGLEIGRSTQVSWMNQADALAEPLVKLIKKNVLNSGYIQLDATPLQVADPNRPGCTREACVWTYRALDGPVFYEFALSKSGDTPAETLQHYQGKLQTDGASNFGGVTKKEGVTHFGCWAHARRYFLKADEAGETEAEAYLDAIDKLFRLERLLRHFKVGDEKVLVARKRHSLPRVDRLFNQGMLHLQDQPLLKKTGLCKAINYLIGQEKALRACFDHAPSRIDNNLVENAIRPLKLGAKNWLFIGHPNAGPRSANLFTLVENCRLAGINPEEYLTDLFTRLSAYPASKIADFLPVNWAKSKNSQP